jgi:Sortase (surface protein transpeptidase)
MIRAWPAAVGRAQISTQLLGEVVLVVLLVVTAASSWRDGIPTDEFADQLAPTAYTDVSGNGMTGTTHLRPPLPVVTPDPPPQPRGPTAPPVQLLIPLLDVHRAVEKIGVDQFGTLNLPVNAWNAGWYKGGPVPGAPGDAVIEGHAGYPGQPMIFGKLATLRRGDRIVVVLADGSRRLFLVVSMRSVPAGSAPSGLAEPSGPPRLTLVTCTGHFDKKSYWYSERLLVEATYAGLA